MEAALLRGAPVAFKNPKPYLMDFERQFMRTPGASMGPAHCYEAKSLHKKNVHVKREAGKLGRRTCA